MNKDSLSIPLLASLGLMGGVFLPWVNSFILQASAVEIMFHKDADALPDSRFLLLTYPVVGFLIFLNQLSSKDQIDLPRSLLYRTPIIMFGVLFIVLQVQSEGMLLKGSDLDDLINIMGSGLWITLISSVLLALSDSFSDQQAAGGEPILRHANPLPDMPLSQTESVKIPEIKTPSFQLPQIDWAEKWEIVKRFILKYKIYLGALVLLGALLIAVYYLFLKADPVAEGKEMAAMVCACHDEHVQRKTDTLNVFINRMKTNEFVRRQQAREALTVIVDRCDREHTQCLQHAEQTFKSRYVEYAAHDEEDAGIFMETYSTLTSNCGSDEGQLNEPRSEIDRLIAMIQDPVPDAVQLKMSLVGQQVTAIGVIALSDLADTGMEILSQEQVGDHIEYLVALTLGPDAYAETRHCKLRMSYDLGNYGWQLTSSRWEEIAFTYRIYPDRYFEFPRVAGLPMTYEIDHKLSWRFTDWWSSTYLVTGPNEPRVEIPTREKYAIKSLEDRDVRMTVRYFAG